MGTLVQVRRLAVDMEADSLYHYFEKVCLLQISTDARTFVVDPLAVRDLAPLAKFMADPETEKVFHAAAYDVLCLRRDHGFRFTNIFDTHVAAQLLGLEQLGLGALLEGLLGVSHSKRRQRDDWSARPLRPDQLEYAATDTHYLLRLRDRLHRQLTEKGRLSWAEEEFQAVPEMEPQQRAFDPEGYRKIKGSRDLTSHQRAVLRALHMLRDRYARAMDLPPFKVMNNATLIDLARKPPLYPKELLRRPGVSTRIAARLGEEIFHTIRKARAEEPPSPAPEHATGRPCPPEARARLSKLKAWRRARAHELGLHIGVVFPGNLLEIMAARPPADLNEMAATNGMRNWRVREFGEEVLRAMAS